MKIIKVVRTITYIGPEDKMKQQLDKSLQDGIHNVLTKMIVETVSREVVEDGMAIPY